MEKEKFIQLLTASDTIPVEETLQLKAIIDEFPYFQAARAVRLKGLKQNQSFAYNSALKKTAAYTTNRAILFEYITSEEFNQHRISEQIKSREAKLQEEEKATNSFSTSVRMTLDEANQITDPSLFETRKKGEKDTKEEAARELKLGEPLQFDKAEAHSFSEWLKLTQAKPIERNSPKKDTSNKEENPKKKDRKFKLIDEFIAKNPKIPAAKEITTSYNKEIEPQQNQLMTETLAKVYLEQKNYSKAIQAYKILILKNPEKSTFFADQIRSIEKLQENKNQ